MKTAIHIRIIILISAIMPTLLSGSAIAKSVYAITDHGLSTVKAYKILEDEIQYQADANVSSYANGAVGVAIDSNLKLLFVTYEDDGKIVWAEPTSLDQKGYIDLSVSPINAYEFAGIVADEEKQRLYVVERQSNYLYILKWDQSQQTLILMDPSDPNQPYTSGNPYVTLTNLEPAEAFGITLDPSNARLYVSNATTSVHVYDIDNGFSRLDTRNVGRAVADVAVDPNNGQHNAFLYCGALYTGPGGGHDYLIKHREIGDVYLFILT